jgi:hypothetical protein
MSGTKVNSDPVTEEVRARHEPHLQDLERLAHESWIAGNFAGTADYFRRMAAASEQAANEQTRGWILQAGGTQNTLAPLASAPGGRAR